MVFFGAVSQMARDAARGKETKMDTPDDMRALLRNGIDRSGLFGMYADIDAMVEKVTRGKVGVGALISGEPLDRYQSRNLSGALVGPLAGKVEGAAQVIGAVASSEWTESDARVARQLMFANNLVWLNWAFNKIETGIGGKEK